MRRDRLQELGYDEAAEAALEATVKAEAGEVRRCRGRVDELASTLSGTLLRQIQKRLTARTPQTRWLGIKTLRHMPSG